MWSTQFHNEPILNEALRRSPVVYLVFGVNKTGQFFGYAKYVIPPRRATSLITHTEWLPPYRSAAQIKRCLGWREPLFIRGVM